MNSSLLRMPKYRYLFNLHGFHQIGTYYLHFERDESETSIFSPTHHNIKKRVFNKYGCYCTIDKFPFNPNSVITIRADNFESIVKLIEDNTEDSIICDQLNEEWQMNGLIIC